MTTDQMKDQLKELHDYWFDIASKLRSLPEKERKQKTYEIGKADGCIDAIECIMLMLGMPVFEMMMEHIAKEREGGGLA